MEELKIETPNGLQFGVEIIGLPDCKFSKYWPLVCCSRATQQIRYRPAVGKEVCLINLEVSMSGQLAITSNLLNLGKQFRAPRHLSRYLGRYRRA